MTTTNFRFLRAHRILPATAWALAIIFAAWVGAQLFWQLSATTTVFALPIHDPDPRAAARRITTNAATSSGTDAPAATPNLRVVGLATGLGDLPGFVLLRADDGSLFNLAEGETLPDGRRLEHIDATGVNLSDSNGGRTTRLAAPTQATTD